MSRGGRREGAGRPKGSKNRTPTASDKNRRRNLEILDEEIDEDATRGILRRLRADAEGGHFKSAELLINYRLGRPQVFSDVTTHTDLTGDEVAVLAEQVRLLTRNGVVVNPEEQASEERDAG